MIKPVVTRVMTFALLLTAVVNLWFPHLSAGQIPQKKQGGAVVITGDNLEIDSEQKIATYTGNVKVVQGTTSMFSDVLVIHLDQAGRQLEKAVATGNVRLVDDNITATGDEGIFYNTDQKLELLNHAKVWQGNNTVTAHQIVAYLQEEVVEGYAKEGGERVIMTVYSTGKVQPSFLKKSDAETSSQEKATPDASSQADASEAPPPESTPAEEESASPVVIISDTLRLDNPAQQATFTGDVVATKDVTKLNADEMVVYISKTADGNDDIDKIEVFGNVRISHETTTVEGEKGVLLNKDQYAKVEGTQKKKAKAKDTAQNLTLEAPVIEIFLETNKIKASNPVTETEAGTSQRIRTVFDGESAPSFFEGASETKQPTASQEDAPEKTFVLTERALKKLEDDEAIPDDVMKPLKNMQDKTYSTEKEFLEAVERRLGKKNAMLYREQLLDAASPGASDRKKDRANDPSVTIIPQSADESAPSKADQEKEAEKTATESTTGEETSKE